MLFKSNINQLILLTISRTFNSTPDSLPVIKVPKYLKTTLNKVRYNERKKVDNFKSKHKSISPEESPQKFNKNVLIISTNNKKMNHYFGQTYRNVDQMPLIAKEWKNGRKTIGSRMRFHIYGQNPSKLVKESAEQVVTFDSLGLNSRVCDAFQSMGLTEPTSIQMAAIPSILDNRNVICCAETGSGKTFAYLAPIIQMIREYKELNSEQTSRHFPKGLVIVPSRELAEQVGHVAQHLAAYCGIGVAVMMGGMPKHITHTGMDLIISTIGLVQPLIQRRVYSLERLNHLVIDESDSLFDDSFSFDVLDLLSNVSIRHNIEEDLEDEEEVKKDGKEMREPPQSGTVGGVQLVCVSATLPHNLKDSLGTVVDLENMDRITSRQLHHIMPHVRQDFYRIERTERHTKLLELVLRDDRINRPVMIFSNRSESSNWIYHFLNENGVQCLRLNKDINDEERADQLQKFQSGECNVMSCTDLGSRGLDTIRVRHVINFDCPHFVSDYIHRSGRTGRMGTKEDCLVSTFVSFKPDVQMLQHLELALRKNRPIDSVNANVKQQLNQKPNIRVRKGKKRKRT